MLKIHLDHNSLFSSHCRRQNHEGNFAFRFTEEMIVKRSALAHMRAVEDTVQVMSLLHKATSKEALSDVQMCVAGSAALWQHMRKHTKEDLSWTPNDIDIFIIAQSKEDFEDKVGEIVQELVEEDEDLFVNESRDTVYDHMLNDGKISVINVHLHKQILKLSFIYHPHSSSVQDMLDSFDIDVCQVAFNVKDGSFTVSLSVEFAILAGEAKAKPHVLTNSCGTHAEMNRARNTMLRMWKHSERGFRFARPLSLKVRKVQDTQK